MNESLATLTFGPLADALMAGLASRTHQWSEWEMLQTQTFDLEWSGDAATRIFRSQSRLAIRVIRADQVRSIFRIDVSTEISASALLDECFANSSSPTGSTRDLPPPNLKLLGLDSTLPQPDPWKASPTRWLEHFPTKPEKVTDLRYRNSKGLFGFEVL